MCYSDIFRDFCSYAKGYSSLAFTVSHILLSFLSNLISTRERKQDISLHNRFLPLSTSRNRLLTGEGIQKSSNHHISHTPEHIL